jgi:hypothetical protein
MGTMISFDDGLSEAPRARRELVERVEPLVRKYMQILDVHSTPRIVVKDNTGSRWLGRTVFRPKDRETTTIELQRQVFEDDRTLERVLAHEMIHHSDFMSYGKTLRLMGGHGSSFLQKAEQINSIMGDQYVTRTSDQSYALPEETSRPFFLLIAKLTPGLHGDRYGYAWAVRLTPKAGTCAQRLVERHNGVAVFSRDPRWPRGAKLGECNGVSVPQEAEDQAELARLYTEGERAFPPRN